MGIEPTFLAWEANVLPLNYTREKCHSKSRKEEKTPDDWNDAVPLQFAERYLVGSGQQQAVDRESLRERSYSGVDFASSITTAKHCDG